MLEPVAACGSPGRGFEIFADSTAGMGVGTPRVRDGISSLEGGDGGLLGTRGDLTVSLAFTAGFSALEAFGGSMEGFSAAAFRGFFALPDRMRRFCLILSRSIFAPKDARPGGHSTSTVSEPCNI